MTRFEQAIQDALNMVDYESGQYGDGERFFEITPDNLNRLIENVCLAVVYDRELQKEIYTKNN